MEEIARRFNEFAFMPPGEISPTEVKDIGSFDVSNDEPVETTNNTDNEETKMKFKPIQEESLDSELKDTKWVEIPNTTAHGVTVTEDDGATDDPFAGDAGIDPNAPAPEGGDAASADATAEAPADAAAADTTVDAGGEPATTDADAAAAPAEEPAPAEGGDAATIDDPKAKMRELLAYYTNYMNELVQDPNTSTDLISATQEMIDSLIKNMESADGIEEVKADAEEAAKEEVSAEEAPAEEAPAEDGGETAPAEEPVAEGTLGGILGGIAGFMLSGGFFGSLLGTGIGVWAGSKIEDFFTKRNQVNNLDDAQLLITASAKEAGANGVTADQLKKALANNKDINLPEEIDKLCDLGAIKKNGDTIMITAEGKEILQKAGYDEKEVQKKAEEVGEKLAAEATEEPATDETDEQKALDAKIDSEVDELHKDDWENIEPATSDNILTPGDLANSPVNDVTLDDVPPTPEEELATTTPDLAAPAPTSDVLDDTSLPTPDEEVSLLGTDDLDEYGVGDDGLPIDDYAGDVDDITAPVTPASNKINWSSDYATNGIATSDDNNTVVPQVLNELSDYYKKVADEVSKVPGKEDVALKLQKIQILSQTIANEWNGIVSQIGDSVASSYDLSNMGDLEKDELGSVDALNQVGADVMADQEKEEEDDLEIFNQIQSFAESFKHLI